MQNTKDNHYKSWNYILGALVLVQFLFLTVPPRPTIDEMQHPQLSEQTTVVVCVYIQDEYTPEEPEDTSVSEQVIDNDISEIINTKEFTITAYDNSVESQEQWVNQTATGFNLKGHSLETAKCIAVDPKVIPLGSEVKLLFDEKYKHLDGVYIARDTGGAIKGNKIDLFMGDGIDKQIVRDFGRRKVQAIILD